MARITVGGTRDADRLYRVDEDGFYLATSGVLRWYTTPTGGTPLTCLLNGNSVTQIIVPTNGQIPAHQWPNGVTSAYADTGLPERTLMVRDVPVDAYSKAEVDQLLQDLRIELAGTTSGTGATGGGTTTPTNPGSGGTTSAAAMTYPTHAVEVYQMIYSSNPSHLGSLQENANVVKLAFGEGDSNGVPRLVGYTQAGRTTLVQQIAALRARGVRVLLSVGGSASKPENGNALNFANTAAFIAGIVAIRDDLGALDGIDFDWEGSTTPPTNAQALAIMSGLRDACGPNFSATMAPNGSNVGTYQPIGVALYQAGYLKSFMHQFYDAEVSESAMMGRVNGWVSAAGAGSEAVYSIGCMNPDPNPGYGVYPNNWWTTAQSLSRFRAARAAYPNLGHAGLWELSRNDVANWCDQVGDVVLGLSA